MELFTKTAAGVLLSVVLVTVVSKQEKDIALVLSMVVCCFVTGAALTFLEPVIAFVYRLEELSALDHNTVRILLKVLGVGLVGEIASLICQDAGQGSLGKVIQLFATVMILYLSLPVFEAVPELMQQILGGL